MMIYINVMQTGLYFVYFYFFYYFFLFCYFACLYCMFILWLFHFASDKVLLKNFTTTTTTTTTHAIAPWNFQETWQNSSRIEKCIENGRYIRVCVCPHSLYFSYQAALLWSHWWTVQTWLKFAELIDAVWGTDWCGPIESCIRSGRNPPILGPLQSIGNLCCGMQQKISLNRQ